MKTYPFIPFRPFLIAGIFSLSCLLSYGAVTEPEPVYEATPIPAEEQVPIRLARISFLEGPVNVQRIQEEDWSSAEINLPLVSGDQIFSGIGGKAELQLEDDVVIWLGDDTFVTIRALDDDLIHFEVLKGTVALKARRVSHPRPPINLTGPGMIVTVNEFSSLRMNIAQQGLSDVLLDRGEALVTIGQDDPIRLSRGQRLELALSSDPQTDPQLQVTDMTPDDDFDRWCDMRDAMAATVVSREYISTRVSGYRDLDQYGDWVEVEEYGRVWTPRVTVVDWAPYRDGRWMWREPFGWTWVSYEPWGWVPYHYGRWVYTPSYRWCWVPTDVVHVAYQPIRPVWCPALVSFTYSSSSSFFSFSVGHVWSDPCIGWFPLGPRDYYYPWYHVGVHYVHRRTHLTARYCPPYAPIGPWGPSHPHAHNPQKFPYQPKGNYSASNNQFANNQNSNNNINVTPVINNNITINNYQNAKVKGAVTVVPRQDFETGNYQRRTAASIIDRNQNDLALGEQAVRALPRAMRSSGRPSTGGLQAAGATASGPDRMEGGSRISSGTGRAGDSPGRGGTGISAGPAAVASARQGASLRETSGDQAAGRGSAVRSSSRPSSDAPVTSARNSFADSRSLASGAAGSGRSPAPASVSRGAASESADASPERAPSPDLTRSWNALSGRSATSTRLPSRSTSGSSVARSATSGRSSSSWPEIQRSASPSRSSSSVRAGSGVSSIGRPTSSSSTRSNSSAIRPSQYSSSRPSMTVPRSSMSVPRSSMSVPQSSMTVPRSTMRSSPTPNRITRSPGSSVGVSPRSSVRSTSPRITASPQPSARMSSPSSRPSSSRRSYNTPARSITSRPSSPSVRSTPSTRSQTQPRVSSPRPAPRSSGSITPSSRPQSSSRPSAARPAARPSQSTPQRSARPTTSGSSSRTAPSRNSR